MKLRALILPLLLAGSLLAADSSLLPNQFAGWQVSGTIQTSKDPAVADATNADVLKEFGFTDLATATYTREGGKLTLKAARFTDTSGAYGAFTYYKLPPMLNEQIPDQGSSLNQRVLFYRGNILVDAVFDHLTAMSTEQLRELAEALLPRPSGKCRKSAEPSGLSAQTRLRKEFCKVHCRSCCAVASGFAYFRRSR